MTAPQIYVSSKIRHAELWKSYRARGVPIISSWLDEDYLDDKESLGVLWERLISECARCKCLILYREEGEDLKGAVVETGAALAGGAKVFVVGDIPELGTARFHPSVILCPNIDAAISAALSLLREK